jgi:NAD(P)-dependent dehydrogenase (short-subunit alcohol dehydrogenase family)
MPASTLHGAHAVVTGGSRGIGAAVARTLTAAGATVTVMARDRKAVEAFCAGEREETGGKIYGVAADITDHASVKKAFEWTRSNAGDPTILVNNAGGAESAPFVKTDRDLWERMIALNLTGAYFTCRQVIPAMIEAGHGRIVNVASTAGVRGYAYVSAYSAAKHGLVGLTRSLALELVETGVKVNAVCPGYADTDMIRTSARRVAEKSGRSEEDLLREYAAANPHGRLVRPEEVAEAVLRFCGPSKALPTGEVMLVDGSRKAG